jgi:hypothetical protein
MITETAINIALGIVIAVAIFALLGFVIGIVRDCRWTTTLFVAGVLFFIASGGRHASLTSIAIMFGLMLPFIIKSLMEEWELRKIEREYERRSPSP